MPTSHFTHSNPSEAKSKAMKNIHATTNPAVEAVFNNYPKSVRNKMLNLRKLILETTSEIDGLTDLGSAQE